MSGGEPAPGAFSSLSAFLSYIGLQHHERSLKEHAIHSLDELLDTGNPCDLLTLTPPEEQALLRGVVLIRRRIRPNLPLPPGKQFNFYLIHNQKTSGSLANALCNSLEKLGGRIFRPEMVTVHGTNGSHSRWHQTTETSMGLALHKERSALGSFRFSYGAGGGIDTGTTLSHSVSRELGSQTLLDQSGTLQSLLSTESPLSHAGLDETTEKGAELAMKLTRHALVVLSDGVLGLEYVTQELRWAQLYGVPLVVLGDGAEGSAGLVRRMEDECASMAVDLRPLFESCEVVPLEAADGEFFDEPELRAASAQMVLRRATGYCDHIPGRGMVSPVLSPPMPGSPRSPRFSPTKPWFIGVNGLSVDNPTEAPPGPPLPPSERAFVPIENDTLRTTS